VTVLHDEVVDARGPWAHVVDPGGTLRIIDLEGNQAVDCILYNADDPAERYSAPDTMVAQGNIFLVAGSQLLSNEGRPMMTVSATTCERHAEEVALTAPCMGSPRCSSRRLSQPSRTAAHCITCNIRARRPKCRASYRA